jgi:uncharacterized protein (DUF1501 family)
MKVTRRQFVANGTAAFTVTFAAPAFLSDLVRAQGASVRNLVVLYLSGGNDALSMLVPYTDPFYASRRPDIVIPAASVLQIGADATGNPLGLHPQLAGLRQIFNNGHLALIQRTGYQNQSRSHFLGTDIWATGNPANATGTGWVGRYLDSLPSPVDALVGWNTTRDLPRVLIADHVPVPAIPNPAGYVFGSPTPAETSAARTTATQISSHVPVDRPSLAYVYGSVQAALSTLDRVTTVGSYLGTATYPNTGLSNALRAVAGAMVRGVGTKVFYVTTGGFDTHASQNVLNDVAGSYFRLMQTLNGGLSAFYTDLNNQGLLQDTLVLMFSEFGRRINQNSAGANAGTDHGAASVMMVMGGRVNGGLYGTSTSLNPANPALENNGNDLRYETDFRSVYARVLDNWLGADSVPILGANFRNAALTFV